jgi:hypothetical protein
MLYFKNKNKMKKLIEKIKLFWATKVAPILKKIGEGFKKFFAVATTKEFEIFFPLSIFALTSFISHNIFFILATLVWLIPTIHEIGKKGE